MVKIKDIFYINQGHQITDEEIYRTKGDIPIYTAGNIVKGYGNTSLVLEKELPCITYQTKGFSGIVSIQEKLFEANNTAALTLKEQYKGQINLEYVAFVLKRVLLEYTTAESGVSYLNKDIVQNIEIDLPKNDYGEFDMDYQNKVINMYNKMQKLNDKLCDLNREIEDVLEYEINIPNFKIYKMDEITNLNKGSNKISEEMIYKNYESGGYPVFSSATLNEGLMGEVKKDCYDKIDKKGHAGELTWTTNGYAGKVFYRDRDYLYSEKCGRIVIKEKFKRKINIKYLMYYLNQITYKYKTAESNNGKLDIIHMMNIPVKIPIDMDGNIDIDLQNKIVKIYDEIVNKKKNINQIQLEIKKVIQ